MLAFIDIDTRDPRYAAELDLRFRVLRAPLGLSRQDTLSPFEDQSLHMLAIEDGELVACVLFRPLDARQGRLYQMAVEPRAQRRGIGGRLIAVLEAEVARRGFEEIVLHAREPAVGFYQRAGYAVAGGAFMEVGIPHIKMHKRLYSDPRGGNP